MKSLKYILFLLLFPSFVRAEIHIDKRNHIQNKQPGICSWCSLETLGRTLGYKQLEDLTTEKKIAVPHEELVKELKERKVKFSVIQSQEIDYFYTVYHELGKEIKTYKYSLTEENAKETIKNSDKDGTWWIERTACWNFNDLKKAVGKDLGIAVTVKDDKELLHMFIVINIDEKEVRIVDSNSKPGVIDKMLLFHFLKNWVGYGIILEKP